MKANGLEKRLEELQMLDDRQVCSLLQLTRQELQKAVLAGLLPAPVRFGRLERWPIVWLSQFLEDPERQSAVENKEK
jgi:predicted DNA-binding transcriptional regulator AlpA